MSDFMRSLGWGSVEEDGGVSDDYTDPLINKAWQLYCDSTQGCMDVVDFWEQLGVNQQNHWLIQAEGYFE